MEIDFEKLVCGSVLGGAVSRRINVPMMVGSLDVEVPVAECRNVLYLPSVLDTGQSLCIAAGGVVPVESILDPWTLDFVVAKRKSSPHLGARYTQAFTVARSDQRVCILGNVFSRNFGHWNEELLKVVVIEALGIGCHYVLSELPEFAFSFLSSLGVTADRILAPTDPTEYASAIFTPAVSHENICRFPAVAALLRRALLGPLGRATSPYARRLWLERGDMTPNGGMTLNKDEVHRCIRAYGFDAVDMANLPVAEQMLAVRDAEAVAGPHGAQFVHVMYLPPRSKVIECFSPDHVNPSVLQICRLLGHSYNQVVSRTHLIDKYKHRRDLVVDCEHLALVLDHLLGDLPPLVPEGRLP